MLVAVGGGGGNGGEIVGGVDAADVHVAAAVVGLVCCCRLAAKHNCRIILWQFLFCYVAQNQLGLTMVK